MGFIALEIDGARVAFTDRHGGVSIAPYDTANLGFATGDDPAAVTENRRRVAHELGDAPDTGGWAWVRQVHGARVVDVDAPGGGGDADAGAQVECRRTGFGAAGHRRTQAARHLLELVGAELVVLRGDARAHDRTHRRPTPFPHESHSGIHDPRK